MKRYVDDVSVLAIEKCLLQNLLTIFTSDTVLNLPPSVIQRVAGESEETAVERDAATEKLRVLEYAMTILNQLKTGCLGRATMATSA